MAPTRRERSPLVLFAAGAPVLFTASWAVLGQLSSGYSQRRGTISALAATGVPHAGPMLAAFAVQGFGQLAGAALARRSPPAAPVAAALAVAGIGTLLAGAIRLPDEAAGGPAWLSTAHALAATAAFGGLHLAALAGALSRVVPRRLRAAAVVALLVAVPHLVWFVSQLGSPGPSFGYAEKAFTTVLLLWCAALALLRRPV